MPPEVLDAMRDASTQFVSIPELHRKAGEELARLTNNEAAWVTAGCAAALALALAACMTGGDSKKVSRLPCTAGMKTEVIVHRCQRNPYDRALLLPGARIVEFGYPTHRATPEQLETVTCTLPTADVTLADQDELNVGAVLSSDQACNPSGAVYTCEAPST